MKILELSILDIASTEPSLREKYVEVLAKEKDIDLTKDYKFAIGVNCISYFIIQE